MSRLKSEKKPPGACEKHSVMARDLRPQHKHRKCLKWKDPGRLEIKSNRQKWMTVALSVQSPKQPLGPVSGCSHIPKTLKALFSYSILCLLFTTFPEFPQTHKYTQGAIHREGYVHCASGSRVICNPVSQ